MYRVEIGAISRQADKFPGAPVLRAGLHLGDWSGEIDLLVDTGADTSLVHGGVAGVPVEAMARGEPAFCAGIGGSWPARRFLDGELYVEATDGSGARGLLGLRLPSVSVLWQEAWRGPNGGHREPLDILGSGAADRFVRCPATPHLLGRDIFDVHEGVLHWVPRGVSWGGFGPSGPRSPDTS